MGGTCSTNEEKRKAYRLLVGKTNRRRPLGRPGHSLVNNSKIDFGEKVCSGVDWIGLAQDRDKLRALMNVVMNLQAPYNAGKLSERYASRCLSSSAQFRGLN
jgi:hypothetical protein